jgi:hypothetical protein
MSARERATGWLEEALGADAFEYRDDGVYTLAAEDGLNVSLQLPELGDVIYLYAPMTQLPEENLEAFYARLLRMNLLCSETQGGTLALDERGNRIVLCYCANAAALDAVGFANMVGNFVEAAAAVRRTLLSVEPALAGAADDSGDGLMRV